MRPDAEVLDLFYGLAELQNTARINSVASLIEITNSDERIADYCVERIIGGISSPRYATRIGFSTTLSLILEKHASRWPLDKVFQLADSKLDLLKENPKFAIGQYLICSSLICAPSYQANIIQIAEKLCQLYRNFPFLKMSICQTFADMSVGMDSKKFKKGIYALIKDYVENAIRTPLPEFFFFVLEVYQEHAAVLADTLSFVKKDGTIHFEQKDFPRILLALKKCEASAVKTFVVKLLQCAQKSDQFVDMYCRVLEKWASSGDESKVLERIFRTADTSLEYTNGYKDVMAVFSPLLVSKITSVLLGRQGLEKRFSKAKITAFCTVFAEKLNKTVDNTEAALDVLSTFEKLGNLEALSLGNITSTLLAKLDKNAVTKWIETVTTASAVRRIISAFPAWSTDAKSAALLHLIKRPACEDILYTISNCLDSLYKIKVRPGESVAISFPTENEAILRQLVEAIPGSTVKKADKALKKSPLSKPLTVLWLSLNIWAHISCDNEKKEYYTETAKEVIQIAESKDAINNTVLIDLLIALLGQTAKFHRAVAYYVFVDILPTIKDEDVLHIFNTLMLSDNELSGKNEDSDDEEDEDMDDNDDNDEAEKSEEENVSEESDEEGEVDADLVGKLKQALGAAAADDEEVDTPDWDDAAMFAMDEKLSAVFKNIAAPGQSKKEASVNMQTFRSKVTDFLLFTVSSANTPQNVKLNLILPLIKLIKVQTKRPTEGPAAKKTVELLEIISKLKKVTSTEKEVLKLVDEIIKESSEVANPEFVKGISAVISFLFSVCTSGTKVPASLKKVYVELFTNFVCQEEGNINNEFATATIYKYPSFFVDEVPNFVDFAFDEKYRIFRRTETVSCLTAILKASDKIDKNAIKKLLKNVKTFLSHFISNIAEKDTIKPRFFASVLKLLLTLANKNDEDLKEKVSKQLLSTLETFTEDEKVWKANLKKCNSACIQLCGKNPLPYINSIIKLL
ncbi:unnamed protein product [Auanema sp. JU1783]|nr:unnamed protein product [Auanema sp. JU1783]